MIEDPTFLVSCVFLVREGEKNMTSKVGSIHVVDGPTTWRRDVALDMVIDC